MLVRLLTVLSRRFEIAPKLALWELTDCIAVSIAVIAETAVEDEVMSNAVDDPALDVDGVPKVTLGVNTTLMPPEVCDTAAEIQ